MAVSLGAGHLAETVASGASQVAEHIPVPGMSTVTQVAGKIVSLGARLGGYYAPELAGAAKQMMESDPSQAPTKNLFDLGEFMKNSISHAGSDSKSFAESMSAMLIDSPLLASLIQPLLQHSVDQKVATNALARAVNKFSELLQNETIQKKITELKAARDPSKKEDLKRELLALVEKEYKTLMEKNIAKQCKASEDSLVSSLSTQIVELMQRKEEIFFGMKLSNDAQTKDLLEALLPALIPLFGVYVKRELLKTKELSKEELDTFYMNVNAALCAPYNGYMVVRGVQALTNAAIPYMQEYAQFLPSFLSESIGQSYATPVINFDDDRKSPQVEGLPRTKGIWESIREKIRLISYMINTGGLKMFILFFQNFMKKTDVE